MDFITRLFQRASDSQLIINLRPAQVSAYLIQSNLFVDQLHLSDTSSEAGLAPLMEFLKKHGCSKPEVSIVLSEGRYQEAQLDKPTVPDEEVRAALQWSTKELISIPPDNMQLDYYDMPSSGPVKRITAVATEKSWLQEWVNLFIHKLKAEVKEILIEELALINLLQGEEAPVLLLWQKPEQEAQLLLVHQNALWFSRKLRGTSGLNHMKGELLAGLVDSMSLEVQRALDYFESNLRQPPVRKVLMLIEGEHQAMVRDLMAANLAADIQLFQHLKQEEMGFPSDTLSLPLLGALFAPVEEVAP